MSTEGCSSICYPIVWLLLLPFKIVGIAVHGVLALIHAIIFLPVRAIRAIGSRPQPLFT